MSIESVMPSSHLILCRPLLLLHPIPPSIRVFSSESTLRIRWPKYWSFSFSISPSNEHPGLISFRMDWLDLLAVQGTLRSLLQDHSSKGPLYRTVNQVSLHWQRSRGSASIISSLASTEDGATTLRRLSLSPPHSLYLPSASLPLHISPSVSRPLLLPFLRLHFWVFPLSLRFLLAQTVKTRTTRLNISYSAQFS